MRRKVRRLVAIFLPFYVVSIFLIIHDIPVRRSTVCQYSRIGCPWQGPFHEQKEHERNCTHPHNTGAQVLQALDLIEQSKKEEKLLYESIIEFLSFEKVNFHGN